ncbi:hypothetical protein [Marimonas lutisalis]|uniref:hypothetical protein n=1 Tax=Marimonas lutisalis TaxID=2545756 RepID=UPI0010F7BBFA|nr:hypothetical protein [Marimonas lutisalis]
MADYREISQEYAQGAIKASVLLNSGAIVICLSQLDEMIQHVGRWSFACAILLYVFGTLFGAVTWVLAFLSTRHVDRKQLGQEETYERADQYMFGGFFSIVVSLLMFLTAALVLAFSLISN